MTLRSPAGSEAVWRTLLATGDVAAIAKAIEAGFGLGPCNEQLHTPLMLAARHTDSAEVIALLIAAGSDPGARDRDDRTAIMHAVESSAAPSVVSALVAAMSPETAKSHPSDRALRNDAEAPTTAQPVQAQTIGAQAVTMVAAAIVRELQVGPPSWVRPWSTSPGPHLPHNIVTRNRYGWFNTLWLWSAADKKAYARHAWLTRLQAEKVGASIRLGEQPTLAFKIFRAYTKKVVAAEATSSSSADGRSDPAGPEPATKTVRIRSPMPAMKTFLLFNVAQVEGLPKRFTAEAAESVEVTGFHAARHLLAGLGADVRHGGDDAYYDRGGDFIRLPDVGQFISPQAYVSTSFHEHVHWTGHPSRLNRDPGDQVGDEVYAFEELVSELGTAFLCAEFGVDSRFEQSAAYIGSWIQRLSDDPAFLFQATQTAGAAVDYMRTACPEAFT